MNPSTTAEPDRWWHRPDLIVTFMPEARNAAAGELLVGIGQQAVGGVVLNHKAVAAPFRSVCDFVLHASASDRTAWRAALPRGMADVRRLVLEDLSLDTCFSLLCFARSVAAEPAVVADSLSPRDVAWCDYVSNWEQGHFDDPDLLQSVAALHALLAHSFELQATDASLPPGPALDAQCRRALGVMLDFLQACWRHRPDPSGGRIDPATPGLDRALAQYQTEQQAYEQVLERSEVLQLLLPLATTGRKVLVDALLVEELAPSGILKLMARADRDHSWTGRGFRVLLFHRPHERGSGNDLTVSVDPAAGLTLRDLWQALEDAEDRAWQGSRPCDRPRALVSYRLADGSTRPGAPNEPWYDDQGRYTLLAAPKGKGSKLTWADLREALWTCYRPVPAQCEVLLQQPLGERRRLAVARWMPLGVPDLTARVPTFERWLAALSRPGVDPAEAAQPPLAGLPEASEFEVLRVPGGQLLVHGGGATLFDDWTSPALDVDGWTRALTTLAGMSDEFAALLSGRFLQDEISNAAELPRQGLRALDSRESDWERRFEEFDSRTMALLAQRMEVDRSAGRANAVAAVERLWDLSAERNQLIDVSERVQDRARRGFEKLKARRSRFFSALVSGAGLGLLAKELFEPVRSVLGMGTYEWQHALVAHAPEELLQHQIHRAEQLEIASMAVMLAFFVIGMVAYLVWDARAPEA